MQKRLAPQPSLIEIFTKCQNYIAENFPETLEYSEQALNVDYDEVTLDWFFAEYVFAVYVAGFKYQIIRQKWPSLKEAYWGLNFVKIAEKPELAYERAIQVFKNVRKTQSVIKGAAIIKDLYWTEYRDKIKEDLSILEELPGIGPASARQIARNIGYDTVKPDTHIKKVAAYFDVDPDMMCKMISEATDLPVHTIDSIFWKCGVEGKLREWLR